MAKTPEFSKFADFSGENSVKILAKW